MKISTALALTSFTLLLACSTRQQVVEYTTQPSVQSEPTTTGRRARIHTELAAGYYARGQHDIALEELSEALKLDPSYAMAHSVKGLVYLELKEDAQAEASFQRAVELAPQDPEIRNNFGWFLCQRSQEKRALEQFDQAIANPLYRTPELALVNAGNCSARIGEIKRAENYYRQAIAILPNHLSAHQGLADIAYKTARYDVARSHLKGAMQTPSPSPAGLLLGVCVERKLGDRQAELSYIQQLRNRYPESKEMKQLIGGAACD